MNWCATASSRSADLYLKPYLAMGGVEAVHPGEAADAVVAVLDEVRAEVRVGEGGMTGEAVNNRTSAEYPISAPRLELVWSEREDAPTVFCKAAVAALGYAGGPDGLEWWEGNCKAIHVVWNDRELGPVTAEPCCIPRMRSVLCC